MTGNRFRTLKGLQVLILLVPGHLYAQFDFARFSVNPALPFEFSLGSNFCFSPEKSYLLIESQSVLFPIEGEKVKFLSNFVSKSKLQNYRFFVQLSHYARIPSKKVGAAFIRDFTQFQFATSIAYQSVKLGDFYGSYRALESQFQLSWKLKNLKMACHYRLLSGLNTRDIHESEWRFGLFKPIGSKLFLGASAEFHPKQRSCLFWLSLSKIIRDQIRLEIRINQNAQFGLGTSLSNGKWNARLFFQYHPYLSLQPYAASSYTF